MTFLKASYTLLAISDTRYGNYGTSEITFLNFIVNGEIQIYEI